MTNVCRLCGSTNKFGMYCAMCVPNPQLRRQLNRFDPDKTNMMLLDFRARNGLSYIAAGHAIRSDGSRWRIAEIAPKQGLTGELMQRIADFVGIDMETLFYGYVELHRGNPKTGGKIKRVIGKDNAPAAPKKPRTIHLPPGVNQHLIALDCREAEKAGYGHSYGKWRAGVII